MATGGEDYSNMAAGGQVWVTVLIHSPQHEDGGFDEINVEGLSGVLADAQNTDKLQGVDVSATTPVDGQHLGYDAADEQWEPTGQLAPLAHKTSHQNGGGDEISVAGLSGALADKQDANKLQGRDIATTVPTTAQVLAWNDAETRWQPTAAGAAAAHAAQHENDGVDEISVEGLAGDLAEAQDAKAHLLGSATHTADTLANLNLKVSDATLDDSSATRTPAAHKTSHQNDGTDEISVAGLSGALADKQDTNKLQGRTLVDTAPSDGQAVVWDAGNSQWEPGTVAAGAKLAVVLNPEAAIFPATSFPALYKVDGTNFSHYEARFDPDGDEWLFFKVPIPAAYSQGNLKVTLYWKAAATTGDVVWAVSHYDRAAGEVLDTTATETQSVTDTVEGTTEYVSTCYVTFSTHPADNDLMIVKVMRDGNDGSDDMAGDAKLLAVLVEEQ